MILTIFSPSLAAFDPAQFAAERNTNFDKPLFAIDIHTVAFLVNLLLRHLNKDF